jgi:hypothetical protein
MNSELTKENAGGKSTCFVIGPIGDPGTTIRKVADQILKHIIEPEVSRAGYDTLRADKIGEPGLVTRQVMTHILAAPLVIADLTGRNPNVYYELAVRHAIRKPLIQLLSGESALPFDIYDTRTIIFDVHDLDSVDEARQSLRTQIAALGDDPKPLDNPISETLDLDSYRTSGDSQEVALGQVLSGMNDIRAELSRLHAQMATPVDPSIVRIGAPFTFSRGLNMPLGSSVMGSTGLRVHDVGQAWTPDPGFAFAPGLEEPQEAQESEDTKPKRRKRNSSQ